MKDPMSSVSLVDIELATPRIILPWNSHLHRLRFSYFPFLLRGILVCMAVWFCWISYLYVK